jgi:glycosyltransferase involved in cell wall biosynthesis
LKASLCIAVWNTSHLLKRSIETYIGQDFDPQEWELVVIDDNSEDDVLAAISPARGRLNVRYERLEHPYGMRGNTVSFNAAFSMAQGEILMETTPETMLPRNTITKLHEPHLAHPRCFVAMKTYNLTPHLQLLIDTVDWRKNLMAIATLPGWHDPWVQNNVGTANFRTHQTCSIRKAVFYELNNGQGFPLFGDWGSEDPWYAGARAQAQIEDLTLPNEFMAIHQWHPPFHYWMAKGKAPNLNRFAHSLNNYLNDRSDAVPAGGTCEIWDAGLREQQSKQEKDMWGTLDSLVRATGAKI